MHRISHLHIKNFRACKDVFLPLESYTPLVGQNNTGKSTVLEALKWVLKPSALAEGDFCDSSKPIVVTARIDGITSDILALVPEAKHRAAIEPYCSKGFLWIRAIATKAGAKTIDKEVYNHEAYPGDGIPEEWRTYPTGLPQAVSALLPEALYIEAMEDIGEDLGKAKSGTTIKELLDEIMVPVLKAHEDLNQALDTIRHILTAEGNNRSEHLKEFDAQATSTLEHFFPGLELALDLQVVDIKEFFKAGDLHVTDGLTGDRRRFDQMGTGAQRSIQMALIRYLAQLRSVSQDNAAARRLLLIDEPELYLHPQGIRRLREALKTLSHAGFQVVFSTHSPLMLSRDNAADTVIVRKNKEQGAITQKPLRRAVQSALTEAESQSRTLFELGNLAEIYFSDLIVLCEGKTDRRLLPLAYERIFGHPPELDSITFLSVGSCSDIPKALPVLHAMEIKACAVADLDFAFRGARKGGAPLLPKGDMNITDATGVLQRLQSIHGFVLDGNGMPQKQEAWTSADIWALLAQDDDGRKIVQTVHEQLKGSNVWIWREGCIEHVTGNSDKGEDAIIKQEEALRAMTQEEIKTKMPPFKACFDWIKSL